MHIIHVQVHVKPEHIEEFKKATMENAAKSRQEPLVARFDVLQQIDRPNFFALFEIWSSAQTLAAFESSPATQHILTSLAPLLGAPLDERDGNLL